MEVGNLYGNQRFHRHSALRIKRFLTFVPPYKKDISLLHFVLNITSY